MVNVYPIHPYLDDRVGYRTYDDAGYFRNVP